MSWHYRDGITYGYVLTTQTSTITVWNANAAGNRLAMRFVARHSGALEGIALRVSSVGGSPQEQDLLVAIHAVASDGRPGTQLEERALGGSSSLTTGRKVITGWTTSLTAGQQYFIVIRNGNASPSTNSFNIAYGVERGTVGEAASPPFGSYTSTDSGSTWGAQGTQRGNYQIIYNTGSGSFTYDWLIIQTDQTIALNNNPVGVRFTTPSNLRLRVVGVQIANIAAISSSSWAIRLKQGGNTLGTTLEIPYTVINPQVPLASPVVLEANTQTDVEAFLVSGTAGVVKRCDLDTTLTPSAFGFQHIENGNVVTGRMVSLMKLILDPTQPFEVVGGGGGGSPIFIPPHRIIT